MLGHIEFVVSLAAIDVLNNTATQHRCFLSSPCTATTFALPRRVITGRNPAATVHPRAHFFWTSIF